MKLADVFRHFFANKYIPWVATSVEYTNSDFSELEIKLNPQAKCGDGVAVTSKDVVFTFEGQLKNEKLPYHSSFDQCVSKIVAKDDLTVDDEFKIPALRFKFGVSEQFDTGIQIVPEHALSNQANVTTYAAGTERPHCGSYDLVTWNANQKILTLRPDWWVVKADLIAEPAVRRVVISTLGDQIGQNLDTVAQRLVNNEMDSALDMHSSVIGNILAQNPKITTQAGNKSPFGHLDW